MSMRLRLLSCALALWASIAAPAAIAQQKIIFLTPAPTTLPGFAAAQLAKAKGYFAAEGVDVEFMAARGGADVGKQIGAGNAAAGFVLGEAPILLRPTGVPVKLVSVFGSGGFSFIVARDDSGIKVPADLKGKTVSVLSYQDTATYYALLGSLASAKLGPSDLNIQALGPTLLWQNLVAGKVDACSCVADWTAMIRASGTKVRVIRHDQYFPAMSHGIAASDRLISENPKLVAGIVRAVSKGANDIRRDPEAAAAAFIAAIPEWKGREAIVRETIRAYAEEVYVGQGSFGKIDPARLEKLQDFFFEHKVIRSKTPVAELYTNQFVPE